VEAATEGADRAMATAARAAPEECLAAPESRVMMERVEGGAIAADGVRVRNLRS